MSRRALLLFLALGVVWGVPYLLIKYALASFTPVSLVLARTALGGLLLLPWALRQRAFGPTLRRWRPFLVYTVAEIAVPWVLLSHAEQAVTSGLAALVLAAVPVVGVVLAFLTGAREHLGGRGVLGLAVGLAGVALLVGREVSAPSGPAAAIAVAELGVVAIGYATGPLVVNRWLADVPSSGVIVGSLLLVAVAMAPWGIAQWPRAVEPSAAVAVVLLGAICTALAFVLFFALVAEVGPVRTTVITYVNPAVAVVAGLVFLDEPLTPVMILGFAAIVGGSVLVQRRPRAGAAGAEVD